MTAVENSHFAARFTNRTECTKRGCVDEVGVDLVAGTSELLQIAVFRLLKSADVLLKSSLLPSAKYKYCTIESTPCAVGERFSGLSHCRGLA